LAGPAREPARSCRGGVMDTESKQRTLQEVQIQNQIKERADRIFQAGGLSHDEAIVLAVLVRFARPLKLSQVHSWSTCSLPATDAALVTLIEKGKVACERDFPYTEYRVK
jgi:hypothetical protein